jgi:hypothetical protein
MSILPTVCAVHSQKLAHETRASIAVHRTTRVSHGSVLSPIYFAPRLLGASEMCMSPSSTNLAICFLTDVYVMLRRKRSPQIEDAVSQDPAVELGALVHEDDGGMCDPFSIARCLIKSGF